MDELMGEISYFHQGTELRIRDVFYSPNERHLSDLSVDWIMVGGTRYFPTGNLKPFAGAALGMVIFSPKNENYDIVNRSIESSTHLHSHLKVVLIICSVII